jgi:hypothetical protein
MSRQTLFHREKVFASDVADAMDAIWEKSPKAEPRAIHKDEVCNQLIRIANTNDDGVMVSMSATSERLTQEKYDSLLDQTDLFGSGYKVFGQRRSLVPVPIGAYCFERVLNVDLSIAEILATMTPVQVRYSLPRREALNEIEDGEQTSSGPVVGVIVFPQDRDFPIVREWLTRQGKVALGHLTSVTNWVGRINPTNARLEDLRSATANFERQMQLVLPLPKSPNGGAPT